MTPLLKTARAQIELFTFQCHKWQLIGKWSRIQVHIETYRYQRQMLHVVAWQIYIYRESTAQSDTKSRWTPPIKTARAQIELFAFQCHKWELIRSFVCNMKRPSVKQSMKWQVSSNFQIYPGKTDGPPPLSDCIKSYTLSLQSNIKRSIMNIYKYIYISKDLLRRK